MDEGFWVFGYGSLMWRPGFEFVERRKAIMYGVHRRLCIYSHVHRGTPEQPGLVLGLDKGGSCLGIGYRVEADKRLDTIAYLREREQVTMIYKECWRDLLVETDTGRKRVEALVYLVDTAHDQYAGKRTAAELVPFVLQGHGKGGPCIDYISSAVEHLGDLGLQDKHLCDVLKLARQTGSGSKTGK
ncbi:MAG: gamma-glutamylcyclotransferase [Anderseniella sp.]